MLIPMMIKFQDSETNIYSVSDFEDKECDYVSFRKI